MTIPFPSDPQLPQLCTLLDGSQMKRLLTDVLRIRVVSVQPKYVRYKPQTSCIVQYDIEFQPDDADSILSSAHVKVFADHRARTKVNSGRAKRLNKRLSGVLPKVPMVAYISEIDGLLQVFPADVDLPGLARLADTKNAGKMIKKALGLESSPTLSAEPELVRYKPGRKALFRYLAEDISGLPLYGKVFEGLNVVGMKNQADALIAAGVATARALGVVEDRNFILHVTVPGIALKELRNRPAYDSWMQPLAKALWQLQEIDLPNLVEHTLEDEIQTLKEQRNQLTHLLPHLTPRLDQVVGDINDGLRNVEDMLVTSHGDFYDDQALVDGDSIAIIDLEALRRSHPLLDAGNMLAHLTVGGARGDDTTHARTLFLDQVREYTGADDQTISLFEAAGIIRLAPGPFRRLEENWPEQVERIVALAEAVLSESQSKSVIDPALPQLSTILDLKKISGPIAKAMHKTGIALANIDLIRHKPGRRAILRFSFEDSSVVFGKTFASKRGPKVYKVTEKIANAAAFGPGVVTPAALGYMADQKLVLLGEVPGDPIEDSLLAGNTELAERIANALFHLHSSDVELGRNHGLEKELAPLKPRCEDIRAYAPHLTERAFALLHRIHQVDHNQICWRLRTIHRDMYHDQILVTYNQLAILDLDDAAMSEPAVDVANFIAHIMLAGIQRHGNANAFHRVIEAFRNTYKELDHDLDEGLTEFLIATTLLRLAGIHVSRDAGERVADQLIETARLQLNIAGQSGE